MSVAENDPRPCNLRETQVRLGPGKYVREWPPRAMSGRQRGRTSGLLTVFPQWIEIT